LEGRRLIIARADRRTPIGSLAVGLKERAIPEQTRATGPSSPRSVITEALLDPVEAPTTAAVIPIVTAGRWGGDVESTVAAAFDAHAGRLKGFALAAVRDSDAADDLVQESFFRLIRELRAGRQPDNLAAWLFRVCGNLIASRARRRTVSDRARSVLRDRATSPSPEEGTIRRDENAILLRALDRLRKAERVALLLSASGLDAAEVGQAIGRTPNATRAFLCRSRLQLRKILAGLEPREP
jgi:RNA polymerase sigma-70 factor (ECF subfamily)